MTSKVLVLWREGEWQCEFHAGFAGEGRLVVFFRGTPATAESTPTGQPAYRRAEVLRQRVRRRDLVAHTPALFDS